MDFNKVENYNNKSFLGSSSSKPIVGVVANNGTGFGIIQAKLTIDGAYVGAPVAITNNSHGTSNAGEGLNPNVLHITEIGGNNISGFILESQSDVVLNGSTAASPQKNQVINVGIIGSGIETYLPVVASVANKNINTKLSYDDNEKALKEDVNGKIALVGPVVDGVKYVLDGGITTFKDTKVVRVRL